MWTLFEKPYFQNESLDVDVLNPTAKIQPMTHGAPGGGSLEGGHWRGAIVRLLSYNWALMARDPPPGAPCDVTPSYGNSAKNRYSIVIRG